MHGETTSDVHIKQSIMHIENKINKFKRKIMHEQIKSDMYTKEATVGHIKYNQMNNQYKNINTQLNNQCNI